MKNNYVHLLLLVLGISLAFVTALSAQFFLHDAWTEFKVTDQLYIGGGLHYWKGMTRLANQSTLNFMTLDQSRPFVHWHSLGVTDRFARHLGIYAKGQIGRFDYRVALNSPGGNPLGNGRDFGEQSDLTPIERWSQSGFNPTAFASPRLPLDQGHIIHSIHLQQ